jgi:hypothetical protein
VQFVTKERGFELIPEGEMPENAGQEFEFEYKIHTFGTCVSTKAAPNLDDDDKENVELA